MPEGKVGFHGYVEARFTPESGSSDSVRTYTGSNVVHDDGLKFHLDLLSQNSSTRSLYLGLMDGTATVASADTLGDRLSSEVSTEYDQSTRVEWLPNNPSSSLSVDNDGNVATYTINSAVTISGPFLSDNSSKGSAAGSAGDLLVSSTTFDGGNVQLSSGTLEVTYRHSAST